MGEYHSCSNGKGEEKLDEMKFVYIPLPHTVPTQ
jgi:hypothetical protein